MRVRHSYKADSVNLLNLFFTILEDLKMPLKFGEEEDSAVEKEHKTSENEVGIIIASSVALPSSSSASLTVNQPAPSKPPGLCVTYSRLLSQYHNA